MNDVILYIPDFQTLVGYLDANHPEMLQRDEDGNMAMPPVVTGFARTPAVIGPDGNSLMVYARLREEQVTQWSDMPHIEVLAEARYQGGDTGDIVYERLFADTEAAAKYDSVYDRTPKEVDDGEGGKITVTPPVKFGVMA